MIVFPSRTSRRSLLGSIAALTTSACRGRKAPNELRLALIPRVNQAGFYLAQELGLFARHGLKVTVEQVPRTEHVLALLAGGRIDIGFTHPNPAFINAVAGGARVRLVAGRNVVSRVCGSVGTLYGSRRSFPHGLHLRELRGKRVAVQAPTSLAMFFLDTMLAAAGLSDEPLNLVYLRDADAIVALGGGKLDAMVSSYLDQSAAALSPDIVQGMRAADVIPGHQWSFIAFGPTLLDADPTVGARFLAAYLEGARAFAAGRTPRFLTDLALSTGLDPKRAMEGCRGEFPPDGAVDEPSVRRFVEWAVRRGFSLRSVPDSSLIDTRFVEAVRAGKGL